MPHLIERAATGRSKCRGCGEAIAAGVLRFGETVPNAFGEGDATHWFHLDCGAFKRPQPFLEVLEPATAAIDDAERLGAEARSGVERPRLARINGAERDKSGRAQCRSCKAAIAKGAWRILLVLYEEDRFMPSGFIHAGCAPAYFETTDVMPRVQRFSKGLTEADVAEIASELQRGPGSPA
jgi:ribosomal protein L37AE/L43A